MKNKYYKDINKSSTFIKYHAVIVTCDISADNDE